MASSLREINILTRSLGGRRVKEKAGGEGREGGWPVEWRQKDVLVHICFLALRDGNFFGGGDFYLTKFWINRRKSSCRLKQTNCFRGSRYVFAILPGKNKKCFRTSGLTGIIMTHHVTSSCDIAIKSCKSCGCFSFFC